MNIVQEALKTILSFSSDFTIIVAIVAICMIFALAAGKRRIVSLIIAFYPSAFIFHFLPPFKQFTAGAGNIAVFTQLGYFLVVFAIIYYILSQYIAGEFLFGGVRKVTDSFLLAISLTGLIILFSYQVVDLSSLYNFGPAIDSLFVGNLAVLWLAIPWAILFGTRE